MKEKTERPEDYLLDEFHVEELEQRLEMKLDWAPSQPQIILTDGNYNVPIYP